MPSKAMIIQYELVGGPRDGLKFGTTKEMAEVYFESCMGSYLNSPAFLQPPRYGGVKYERRVRPSGACVYEYTGRTPPRA